jgi:aspartyl aminopeptidase
MMYTDINDVFVDDELIGTEKIDNKFVNEYANLKAIVTDKTSNTVEVIIFTQREEGINAIQWFMFNDFIKRFKFD